jgi:hypothetical protein
LSIKLPLAERDRQLIAQTGTGESITIRIGFSGAAGLAESIPAAPEVP